MIPAVSAPAGACEDGKIRNRRGMFLVSVCAGLLWAGCGEEKPGIREDDPSAVVALKEAGAYVERVPMMGAKDMIGRNVDLSDTSMEPEVFEHLGQVESVGQLKMSGPHVTDEALALLGGLEMRSLSILDLSESSVTDAGLKHLASLKRLSNLNLSDTHVTGAGLADLPPLTTLQLTNLPIGDSDLQYLSHMNNLQFLILSGTRVTPSGLAKFKQGRGPMIVVGVKQM